MSALWSAVQRDGLQIKARCNVCGSTAWMPRMAFGAPKPPPCRKCGTIQRPITNAERERQEALAAEVARAALRQSPAIAPEPKPKAPPKPRTPRRRRAVQAAPLPPPPPPVKRRPGQRITSPLQVHRGERYGHWTVLEPRTSIRHALCRCDCGTERQVWRQSLQTGSSTSCGACGVAPGNVRGHWRITAVGRLDGKQRNFEVECIVCGFAKTIERSNWYAGHKHVQCRGSMVTPGTTWGRWTVLRYEHGYTDCRCECGTLRRIAACRLRDRHTQSCGCGWRDLHTEEAQSRVGQTYGDWTVDSYRKTGKGIAYAIRCAKCGHTTERRFSHFALTRSHCSACSPKPRHTKRIDLAAK